MSDNRQFEDEFWSSIQSDMTAMVGTDKVHPKPMTAQFDGDERTIFFFTARGTELAESAMAPTDATLVYSAKGHDLFATVQGKLLVNNDPDRIERLWNRYVAAWFEGGKDDPRLCLLSFEPGQAEIWKDASSVAAGVKLFLGMGDPKEDYKDSVATVRLG